MSAPRARQRRASGIGAVLSAGVAHARRLSTRGARGSEYPQPAPAPDYVPPTGWGGGYGSDGSVGEIDPRQAWWRGPIAGPDPIIVGSRVNHHTRGVGKVVAINVGGDKRIHVRYQQDASVHVYSKRSWRSGKIQVQKMTRKRRESLTMEAKGIVAAGAARQIAAREALAAVRGGPVVVPGVIEQPMPEEPEEGWKGLGEARAVFDLGAGGASRLSKAVIEASDGLSDGALLTRDTFVAIVCSTLWPLEVSGDRFQSRVRLLRTLYESCMHVDDDEGVDGETLCIVVARLAKRHLSLESCRIACRLFDADGSGGISEDELSAFLVAHYFIDNAVRDDVSALDTYNVHRQVAAMKHHLLTTLGEEVERSVPEDSDEENDQDQFHIAIPNDTFGTWMRSTWRPTSMVYLESAPAMPGIDAARATISFAVGSMDALAATLLNNTKNAGALPPRVFLEVVAEALAPLGGNQGKPMREAHEDILLTVFHTMDELHVGTVDSSFLASALTQLASPDDIEGVHRLLIIAYDCSAAASGGIEVEDLTEYMHCTATVKNALRPPGVARESLEAIESKVQASAESTFEKLGGQYGGLLSTDTFLTFLRDEAMDTKARMKAAVAATKPPGRASGRRSGGSGSKTASKTTSGSAGTDAASVGGAYEAFASQVDSFSTADPTLSDVEGGRTKKRYTTSGEEAAQTSSDAAAAAAAGGADAGMSDAVRAAAQWATHWSKEHKAQYFTNSTTGATTWEIPPELAMWNSHAATSVGGAIYYVNSVTRETCWEVPPGWGLTEQTRPPPLPPRKKKEKAEAVVAAAAEAAEDTFGELPSEAAMQRGGSGRTTTHMSTASGGGGKVRRQSITAALSSSSRAAAAAARYTGPWKTHWSQEHSASFYTNSTTGETTWTRPADLPADQ